MLADFPGMAICGGVNNQSFRHFCFLFVRLGWQIFLPVAKDGINDRFRFLMTSCLWLIWSKTCVTVKESKGEACFASLLKIARYLRGATNVIRLVSALS